MNTTDDSIKEGNNENMWKQQQQQKSGQSEPKKIDTWKMQEHIFFIAFCLDHVLHCMVTENAVASVCIVVLIVKYSKFQKDRNLDETKIVISTNGKKKNHANW